MRKEDALIKDIYAALEHDTRVNLHRSPITVRCLETRTFWLLGEVNDIEEKRAAVECTSAVAGVHSVIDRLRVRSSTRPGDGAIRDAVCRHLMNDRAYQRCAIGFGLEGNAGVLLRNPDLAEGNIDVSVIDGVVTLRGQVISLSHRRLAAVLAWWSPGCRNTINELDVSPREDDNDAELQDAILMVLEKDPLVHADRITTLVRNNKVVLRGQVPTQAERKMAAQDVWYVEGAREVINEIRVY